MEGDVLEGSDAAELLEVLGGKYNAEILSAVGDPLSAQEISDELDVPIATCYRRISELTELGLLTLEDSVLSDEHRRVDVYRRGVKSVRVKFSGETVNVSLEEQTRVMNKLDEAWRGLSGQS